MKVNIKTFGGDYLTFDVNGVKDLLEKLKEYNEEYSIVCLYDIKTEERIKMEDEMKDDQELFMVVPLVDVEMDSFTDFPKDDPKFYVNVELEFICDGRKHNENIFYYPTRGVIIEGYICCLQCEYRDEYKDLESYLEKKLKYPDYQKKLAIRDASLLWNKMINS